MLCRRSGRENVRFLLMAKYGVGYVPVAARGDYLMAQIMPPRITATRERETTNVLRRETCKGVGATDSRKGRR